MKKNKDLISYGTQLMIKIRQAGHSVTKDKRSSEEVCILHGKRADSGDTWTESATLEDMSTEVLAGKEHEKRDALQCYTLMRLTRFLFPELIGE